MPRTARTRSKTGIYHVMLRGNERKNIFKDDEDKTKFLDILFRKKEDENYFLYAYCLMDNHLHLIIKENKIDIAAIMKGIGIAYAYYFNQKYRRVGHVFQDRFKSEIVEDESYLLSVIRYVHQNPQAAGIGVMETYSWSSFQRYINIQVSGMQEILEVLGLFSLDTSIAIRSFRDFHLSKELESSSLDMEINKITMDYAEVSSQIDQIMLKIGLNRQDLQKREYMSERKMLLKNLLETTGWSLRKIAEITGLNREVVRKSLSKEPSP
jgi:putative transposase